MAVFCRIAETRWRRVLDQDQSGVLVDSADLSFADVWEIDFDRTPRSNRSPERRNWNELLTPLPSENIPCIGYALTYPGHRAEVSLEKILFFEKNALPERAQDDIAHREHLDFEAEIGVRKNSAPPFFCLFGNGCPFCNRVRFHPIPAGGTC